MWREKRASPYKATLHCTISKTLPLQPSLPSPIKWTVTAPGVPCLFIEHRLGFACRRVLSHTVIREVLHGVNGISCNLRKLTFGAVSPKSRRTRVWTERRLFKEDIRLSEVPHWARAFTVHGRSLTNCYRNEKGISEGRPVRTFCANALHPSEEHGPGLRGPRGQTLRPGFQQ